jgi:hypothetical protein
MGTGGNGMNDSRKPGATAYDPANGSRTANDLLTNDVVANDVVANDVVDADWLDGLLVADAREYRAVHIADDGFAARVMQALPTSFALPAWRKPALVSLWTLATVGLAVTLPGAALDVAREAYRLLAAHPVSLSGMVGAVACAGVLAWTAAAYALRTSDLSLSARPSGGRRTLIA